ncbi:hypothetical protein MOF32_28730 [Priestia megaterium]|uniref:hypothetical protein n=1 Tax=Priestia megaterium TaxID=1404 RepID=UPI002280A52B|nr:hypothetical protein [Priestia megaterium]MCY9026864.1 hypothetical protein [Priestia megaterium]
MGILNSLLSIFKSKPKEMPDGYKEGPICEGTGEYDSFIDCLTCDGEGHIESNQYYDKLVDGNLNMIIDATF